MAKTMTFRFEPGMGLLLQEIVTDLTERQICPITKTEVLERAVAVLYSLLTSGNVGILSSNPDIETAYRRALVRIYGLNIKQEDGNNE